MKLKVLLKNRLNKKELELVPSSFDVVGDILIFSDFPKELKKREKIIVNTILKNFKNIRVVAKKIESYKGRYRTRKVRIIGGEKRKETTHLENNVKLKLNVETCYFSPRLGNERLRIAKQIKKNEDVLVMFNGISPYALTIAKNSKVREVYGVEVNPEAHKYAEENLRLNKVNNVKLFKGDVKKVLPGIKKKFDRVLMPLPKTAEKFLELALSKVKKNGIIHFYNISREDEFPDASVEKVKERIKEFRVLKVVKCGQYSPGKYRICVDFRVLK